jgi:monofunctional biosynthetic peptidoglycan transglycosylase
MRPFFSRLLWLLAVYAVLIPLVTALQCAVLIFHDPVNTAWMRLRVREARRNEQPLHIRHTWVPAAVIPELMKRAVVAAEDERFYEHHGFEWQAIKEALERNEKSGKIRRGGSTITQQLAKNLFLSPNRSYWRKLREALITVNLELLLSKERILEIYLNSIELGPGVFGIEAAAQYHFHIPARRLNVSQCCRLAALIPAPRRYRVTGDYVSRRAATLERIIAGAPPELTKPDAEADPKEQVGSE